MEELDAIDLPIGRTPKRRRERRSTIFVHNIMEKTLFELNLQCILLLFVQQMNLERFLNVLTPLCHWLLVVTLVIIALQQ